MWKKVLLIVCNFYYISECSRYFNILYSEYVQENNPIVYVYAHGLRSTKQQALDLFARINGIRENGTCIYNPHWILAEPLLTFNFPDAKNNTDFIRHEVNLGQEKDINRLKDACEYIHTQLPECAGLILAGVSRGASTIFNFCALHRPPYVKAAILESPYDTLNSVVKHLLRRYYVSWFPFSRRICMKLIDKHFPQLKINGIFPLSVAQQMSKQTPILLVHPVRDKVVPVNSSRKLYLKLRLMGHTRVHLLELPSGSHAHAIQGPYGNMFQCTVHAFYKKYNLPYEESFAKRGCVYLSETQPGLTETKALIEKTRSPNEEIYDDIYDPFFEEEDDNILPLLDIIASSTYIFTQ